MRHSRVVMMWCDNIQYIYREYKQYYDLSKKQQHIIIQHSRVTDCVHTEYTVYIQQCYMMIIILCSSLVVATEYIYSLCVRPAALCACAVAVVYIQT